MSFNYLYKIKQIIEVFFGKCKLTTNKNESNYQVYI